MTKNKTIETCDTSTTTNHTTMGDESEEERKREASRATTSASNPKPKAKATQSQLEKFKELNQKLLQIKEKTDQKTKLKGISSTRKRPCLELESKANKDAPVPINCTEPEKSQHSIPAELEGPASVPHKYRRKLHWGLDTKERWERKSNM
ncbi:hypothetical protein LUZ61_006061 [Rhynchospora tenuis]|uniref:Uncharacterized protein n=1 Tax=Rhynchospora tenuis TaxID=198213 RepID=A0AAD6EV55_9POAL|nr:hypothetical protein LUZ61_006061 [Rhynchospora tenuis]